MFCNGCQVLISTHWCSWGRGKRTVFKQDPEEQLQMTGAVLGKLQAAFTVRLEEKS